MAHYPTSLGIQHKESGPKPVTFLPWMAADPVLWYLILKTPSEIPLIAEPFFMNLHANVEFSPFMNDDDMQKGLEK